MARSWTVQHVGLPPATAVHSMLQRAAGRAGQVIDDRAIVSDFDAELRVAAAGPGISVTPKQVALRSEKLSDICAIALTDACAKRRFAVCFRNPETLSPAALRMVEFLASRAASEQNDMASRQGRRRPAKGMMIDASRT